MNADELLTREFTVVRKGFDPEEVRAFLAEISSSELVTQVDPDGLVAAARQQAAQIIAEAQAAAATATEEADAYSARVRAEADVVHEEGVTAAKARVTEALEQSEQLLSDAEAKANDRITKAELHARERSTAILDEAKLRLHRLLDAEAEVHVRLTAAFATVQAPSDRPVEREDEAMLDLAFAEFFASEIEHDDSRAWILSDHAG